MNSTDDAAPAGGAHPLDGVVVVDLSAGIAGGYCTKVLADAGADVLKIEPPEGDSLRRRGTPPGSPVIDDSALFRYLGGSKRSTVVDVTVSADVERAQALVAAADVVVWTSGSSVSEHPAFLPARLRVDAPSPVVVAITPFGLDGPWAERPCTPATLEAWSGGPGARGDAARPPVLAGGEQAEWMAGMFASTAALFGLYRRSDTGVGELIDVSTLESLIMTQSMYPVTWDSIAGYPWRSHRVKNLPDVHPTLDGHVGFMVVTGQQWLDFCILVERFDWLEDEQLILSVNRQKIRHELLEYIDQWTSTRTTAEITEMADILKVPSSPVGNGRNIPQLEHFVAQNFYVENPRGGFVQPDVPYTLSAGVSRQPVAPAPVLGETALVDTPSSVVPRFDAAPPALPLEGIRVADFTAFWAGPVIGNYLAMMGADVIHIESHERPDAMRMSQVREPGAAWWEWAPLYQGANTNKRDLGVDLSKPEGVELARRVIAECDIVIENYRPSVMESWGLDYESLSASHPDLIMVRAPAYGTAGPWRGRGGYAQTMEHVSGMAFLTGFPDETPQCVNGPCDPVAGTHATIALLLALHHRRQTGEGMLVEVAMVGGALNVAAEGVIEWSANGVLLERAGNRSRFAAPQGFYLAGDPDGSGSADRWVAISIATDEHWRALCGAIGELSPLEASCATLVDRHTAHDQLDEIIGRWCRDLSVKEIVDELAELGIPVAEVLMPQEANVVDQHRHRGFFEEVVHPLLGTVIHNAFPARFSAGPHIMNRRHAPLLGEHNEEILADLVGLDTAEIERLRRDGVIGTSPSGARGNLSVQAP